LYHFLHGLTATAMNPTALESYFAGHVPRPPYPKVSTEGKTI